VQGIQLVVLLTGATVGAAGFALWFRRRSTDEQHFLMPLLLGIVAGFVGLVLVLVPEFDTVPDDTEVTLRVIVVIGVTLFIVAGTVYRLTHR
jgi:zinc transporter ZupT